MGRGIEVVVGREYAEAVEVLCGTAVISVRILELTEVVSCGDLFQSQLGRGVNTTTRERGERKTKLSGA